MPKRRSWILTAAVCIAAIMLSFTIVRAEAATIEIQVSPQTLLPNADQGGSVTVHVDLDYSLVNELPAGTILLSGVPASISYSDARGDLVCKFPETAVKALFDGLPPGDYSLTLTGLTEAGEDFAGTDEVRVTNCRGR